MSAEVDKRQNGNSLYTIEASSSSDSQYQRATSVNSNSYDTAGGSSRRANFANNAAADLTARKQNGHSNGTRENDEPQEDLWSNILNSVKSSRAIPVKNVIILGEQRTGKSTLLSHLASSSSSSSTRDHDTHSNSTNTPADLGLGYSYFDVADDEGEDVIARVGTFQISSAHASYLSLLPLTLAGNADTVSDDIAKSRQGLHSSKSAAEHVPSVANGSTRAKATVGALRDTLFLITLDWEAPWAFLTQLLAWLDIVREVVEGTIETKGKHSQEQLALDELKESLETIIRSYKDLSGPSVHATADEDVGETSVASAIAPVNNPTAEEGDDRIPLPEGSLTHNLGVPIVIVCTKADTIPQLERDRNFKEEKFDYIQQVLRTISLKYGAALFFTAQSRPKSFEVLRSYILHRLFGSDSRKTTGRSFAFTHRPSTVERDVLVVPAGWDSFGKIRALREAFDCAGMANGWEWDSQVERIRRRERLPRGSRQAEELAEQEVDRRSLSGLIEGDRSGVESTVKLYEAIVEDWDAQNVPASSQNSNRVKEPDDQAFLLQYFTSMQKEVEVKSKSNPQVASIGHVNVASNRSVVGPLGSSSLSLPNVERVMQERQHSDEGRSSKTSTSSSSRGQSTRDKERRSDRDIARSAPAPRHAATSAMQSPPLSSSDKAERGASRPTSPLSSAQAGAQTPKQSEVLHSFFQSLLKDNKSGGGSAGASSRSTRTHATGERERDREREKRG